MMTLDKILVIGANGQVGSALVPELQVLYGKANVIAADLYIPENTEAIFEKLDATDSLALAGVIKKYQVTQIYHLAAILSAKGEADPVWAWNINMQTLLNVLSVAKEFRMAKLFIPSSIAVFGHSAPGINTPQSAYLDPSTIYGVSKVATENLAYYYHKRFDLDIRSLRYPGIISYQSLPGGGTTDYAVEIFHEAIAGKHYTCYLHRDTVLPMIYINDAIRATIELMEADAQNITVRSSYNLAGVSFTPADLYAEIRKYFPDFSCEYVPDFRQDIANSWPRSVHDLQARNDWKWKPQFDLSKITVDMIAHLASVKFT